MGSSSSSSSSSSGGISMLGLLGIIFAVAKIAGYINWPWIWVLAPFWIPAVIGLTILAVIGIIAWFATRD